MVLSSDTIENQRRVYDTFYGDGGYSKTDLTEGDRCVIISRDWFNKWTSFIGRSPIGQPGTTISMNGFNSLDPIDFSSIMENGNLKKNLLLEVDVTPVSEKLFDALCVWYGLNCKKNEVPYREIYKTDKSTTFDLYPPRLKLTNKATGKSFEISCCASKTIGYIKSRILDENGLKSNIDVRIWDADNEDEIKGDVSTTLKECSLMGDKTLEYSVGSCTIFNGFTSGLSSYRKNYPVGVCGLSNLGNTCFMNSAIQCISNVAPLRDFVLSGNFHGYVNENNRLGSHGEIAYAFEALIKEMWSEQKRGSNCVPRDLKIKIGRYAPQFLGFNQHDALELMVFLLDFLHEDLNKIKEKPYIEAKDADGRPDEEVAEESWSNFKLRNDSIIVDLFFGLLKSTVECPNCGYISVTFDPFSSLAIPLDIKHLPVHVGPFDQISLPVIPQCRAEDIVQSLEHHLPPKDNSRYVVALMNGGRFEVVPSDENRSLAQEKNIYVFNVSGEVYLKVVLIPLDEAQVPLLVSMERHVEEISKNDLCEAIKSELKKYNEKYLDLFDELCNKNKLDFATEGEICSLKSDEDIKIYLREKVQLRQDKPKRFEVKLENCIDLFLTSEQLGSHDLWYCKKCKSHQQAFKKFDLWKLPSILVIHLKRYKNGYRFTKNEIFVDYPVSDFQLPHVKNSPVYDLTAVSNHMGGLSGGHYTALAKNGNDWYTFNDSYVDQYTGSPVDKYAYILVYSAKQVPPPNGH